MVRSLKKFGISMVVCAILISAICGTVSATTYEVYEGNLSSTQLNYFRDNLANVPILDNYVVFRDGQYSYKMVVGDISYSNKQFTSSDTCKVYSIDTGSGYNSYYSYNVSTIDNLTLNTNSYIVYSDLGDFPQLEERGGRYEVIQTIIISIIGLCMLIRGLLYTRKR